MVDVFISYAREDDKAASALDKAFADNGLSVFRDTAIQAGERWDQKIEGALHSAKAIVVLWSEASVASHWVKDEASVGVDQGNLVPIALGGTVPPLGYRQIQAFPIGKPSHLNDPEAIGPILARVAALTDIDLAPAEAIAKPAGGGKAGLLVGVAALAVLIGGGAIVALQLGLLGSIGDAPPRRTGLSDRPAAPVSTDPSSMPAPGTVFRDCEACPQMTVVPAGQGIVGASEEEIRQGAAGDQGPQHRIVISQPFAVSIAEVTVGEYRAFAKATARPVAESCIAFIDGELRESPETSFEETGLPQNDDHPAVCLNWHDAADYVAWLSETTGAPYRLLSEAEWEYAARAGTEGRFPFGDDPNDACRYANIADRTAGERFSGWRTIDCNDGHLFTAPVGSTEPNAFGLYDMIGNVWEWTEDCWHESYHFAPIDGTAWIEDGDCSRRVVRGGAWDIGPRDSRVTLRGKLPIDTRHNLYGFRVARDF